MQQLAPILTEVSLEQHGERGCLGPSEEPPRSLDEMPQNRRELQGLECPLYLLVAAQGVQFQHDGSQDLPHFIFDMQCLNSTVSFVRQGKCLQAVAGDPNALLHQLLLFLDFLYAIEGGGVRDLEITQNLRERQG